MKLEIYPRMANLPYEIVLNADSRKAPKGKLPYIEDGGKLISDSGFIIDYLKVTYGDPLDADLAPTQRAVALGFRRLIEERPVLGDSLHTLV